MGKKVLVGTKIAIIHRRNEGISERAKPYR